MKLTDMKRTKSERKTDMPAANKIVGDDYGYGLRVRLDKNDIKKLGIDLPAVGDYFELEAVCCVTSVSQNESNGHADKSVELQIEQMALDPEDEKDLSDAVNEGIDEADAASDT